MRYTKSGINDAKPAVFFSMCNDKKKAAGRLVRMVFCIAAGVLLTGCGISSEKTYTREELDNVAKLELYEAGSDEPLKTIEDENTLYQYVQAARSSEYAFEAETEKELKETAENAGETCCLAVYKYPAAKFGDKEPEKNYSIILYQDVNIAKLAVEGTTVKNIALPEELLTFYYEMSEEESAFYKGLVSEK